MYTRALEFRTAIVSLCGAGMWAALAVLAGLSRAPFGVFELMLLFAVLVVVPLGFRLAGGNDSPNTGIRAASIIQPMAVLCVVAGFWVRPGWLAAGLNVPWFVLGVVVTITAAWDFLRNQRSLADLAVILAGVDLAFAGGWLVVSRAGLHPMGFQEPIVLLTAVHFHYSGFAMAALAAASIRVCEGRMVSAKILRPIVCLILFLPFVLAAGFVVSPTLRMVAALALVVTVPAFAASLFRISRLLELPVARFYMRMGAVTSWIAMGMAGLYAVTDYVGKPFLTMPAMASTHGVLNGIGFVMFSMLAFLMDMKVLESASVRDRVDHVAMRSRAPRNVPVSVPLATPEFVAREFYDR